jgi:voltage-gated potassium channel
MSKQDRAHTVGWQQRTFELLQKGTTNDVQSKLVDTALLTLILFSVLCVLLESESSLYRQYQVEFFWAEIFCTSIFLVEYLLRIWSAPCENVGATPLKSRLQYVSSFYGIVDLVAIAPFLLSTFFPVLDLRVLRLFRVLRIFKVSHYNSALQDLGSAIYAERKSFFSTLYIFVVVLVVCSSLIYIFENKAQPEKFSSIIQSMWWTVVTLTTVGYGDVAPITAGGKFIGATTAVLGVCSVALLTGVVANAFGAQLARKRAIFESAILQALQDGVISSAETDLLKKMRDEFNLSAEHADAIFLKALEEHKQRTRR